MIYIANKKKCCGCNACVQCCPKQCITMHEDEEGFLYPKVDVTICIECGLCEKVCPVINQNESKRPLQVYAAKNNNEEQRLCSSSGGIFIILAEQTINQGGVVFGCRFDKNWEVEHCYVETLEELEPLMRSKYVQSRIGNTYKEAEQFLKAGRKVLFIGVPCHIAGLKKYLRKDYNDLLTIDIVCHGVPSPKVWKDYLNSVAHKNVKSINFRAKQTDGYSWKGYGIVIKGIENEIVVSQRTSENVYMMGFAKKLFLRPSCHDCSSKSGKCGSDLTIGDFWGIWNKHPELDDNKGTSMLIVYSVLGQNVLESLDLNLNDSTYDEAIKGNPMILYSAPEPKERKEFWENYTKYGITYIFSIVKSMQPSFFEKIFKSVIFRLSKITNY